MSLKIKPNYVNRELTCFTCGILGVDLHHLKSRKSHGAIDEDWNLLPVCRRCHSELHTLGLLSFVKKHLIAKEFLLHHNWSICELTGKWKHE